MRLCLNRLLFGARLWLHFAGMVIQALAWTFLSTSHATQLPRSPCDWQEAMVHQVSIQCSLAFKLQYDLKTCKGNASQAASKSMILQACPLAVKGFMPYYTLQLRAMLAYEKLAAAILVHKLYVATETRLSAVF